MNLIKRIIIGVVAGFFISFAFFFIFLKFTHSIPRSLFLSATAKLSQDFVRALLGDQIILMSCYSFLFFHIPPVQKLCQPLRSHLSKARASQSAHSSMSPRYTISGRLITHGCGMLPAIRSRTLQRSLTSLQR